LSRVFLIMRIETANRSFTLKLSENLISKIYRFII